MLSYRMNFRVTSVAKVEFVQKTIVHPLLQEWILPGWILGEVHPRIDSPSDITTDFLVNLHTVNTPYPDVLSLGIVGERTGIEFTWRLMFWHEQFNPVQRMALSFTEENLGSTTVTLDNLMRFAISIKKDYAIEYVNLFETQRYRFMGELPYFNLEKTDCSYTIGWMTYFGKEIVDYVGVERFKRLQTCHEKLEIDGGYLIVLQEEPFSYADPSHRAREAQALEELGLADFTK